MTPKGGPLICGFLRDQNDPERLEVAQGGLGSDQAPKSPMRHLHPRYTGRLLPATHLPQQAATQECIPGAPRPEAAQQPHPKHSRTAAAKAKAKAAGYCQRDSTAAPELQRRWGKRLHTRRTAARAEPDDMVPDKAMTQKPWYRVVQPCQDWTDPGEFRPAELDRAEVPDHDLGTPQVGSGGTAVEEASRRLAACNDQPLPRIAYNDSLAQYLSWVGAISRITAPTTSWPPGPNAREPSTDIPSHAKNYSQAYDSDSHGISKTEEHSESPQAGHHSAGRTTGSIQPQTQRATAAATAAVQAQQHSDGGLAAAATVHQLTTALQASAQSASVRQETATAQASYCGDKSHSDRPADDDDNDVRRDDGKRKDSARAKPAGSASRSAALAQLQTTSKCQASDYHGRRHDISRRHANFKATNSIPDKDVRRNANPKVTNSILDHDVTNRYANNTQATNGIPDHNDNAPTSRRDGDDDDDDSGDGDHAERRLSSASPLQAQAQTDAAAYSATQWPQETTAAEDYWCRHHLPPAQRWQYHGSDRRPRQTRERTTVGNAPHGTTVAEDVGHWWHTLRPPLVEVSVLAPRRVAAQMSSWDDTFPQLLNRASQSSGNALGGKHSDNTHIRQVWCGPASVPHESHHQLTTKQWHCGPGPQSANRREFDCTLAAPPRADNSPLGLTLPAQVPEHSRRPHLP